MTIRLLTAKTIAGHRYGEGTILDLQNDREEEDLVNAADAAWVIDTDPLDPASVLIRAYNLADLPDKAAARTNLGLGSLATQGPEGAILDGVGARLELGSNQVPNSPYFDFRSSGLNIDFDARFQATGGTATSGNGGLLYVARAGHRFSGNVMPSANGGSALGANDTRWSTLNTHTIPGGTGTLALTTYTTPGGLQRLTSDKLAEVASVKDFGAVGDGIVDDSAAIQAAINSIATAGTVHFPAGNYRIDATITLPEKPVSLRGEGFASRIFGAVDLVAFPASSLGIVQEVDNLYFEQTGDAISLKLHQTWYAWQKVGPRITNCFFYNSKAGTTTAKCLSVMGITQAKILNNHFRGLGAGGHPTTGIGGYGIFLEFGSDMNTSVMNLDISNNTFWTVGNPIWIQDRVISTGGRAEGISITNNILVAGNIAIRLSETLATLVNGNLITDFDVAVDIRGDLAFVITGNTEIDGATASIRIAPLTNSFVIGGTIAGNIVKVNWSGSGILIDNTIAAGRVQSIAIAGNTIGKTLVGSPIAGNGVRFTGTYDVRNISISGNTFSNMENGILHNAVTGIGQSAIGNTFYSVTNEIANRPSSFVTLNISDNSSGVCTFNGASFLLSNNMVVNGNSVEIGSQATPAITFIDFHSSGVPNDFDARISASGGSATAGQGGLTFTAASFIFNNLIRPVANNVTPLGANTFRFSSLNTHAIPPGTGTLALAENLSYKSVKDFGAKGDGVTDDTSAIQAALNSTHQLIYFPPGTYEVSNKLTHSGKPIAIIGAGANITSLRWSSLGHESTNPKGILFTQNANSHSIIVRDIAFITASSGTSGVAITVNSNGLTPPNRYLRHEFTRVEIAGLTAVNLDGWYGGIDLINASQVEIHNCAFAGRYAGAFTNKYSEFFVKARSGGVAPEPSIIQLHHCSVYHTNKAVDTSDIEGVFIQTSNFVVVNYGLYVSNSETNLKPHIQFTDNHVNAHITCCHLHRVSQSQISHNLLYFRTDAGDSKAVYGSNLYTSTITGNKFVRIGEDYPCTGIHLIGASSSYSLIDNNIFQVVGTAINLDTGTQNINVGASNSFGAVTTPLIDAGTNNYKMQFRHNRLEYQGIKILGARDTGWGATMTGTADKITVLDVATATTPQVAARVKALEDALRTHGLIGS